MHDLRVDYGIFMLIGTIILKIVSMVSLNSWTSIGTLIAALATSFYFIVKAIYLLKNKGMDEKK